MKHENNSKRLASVGVFYTLVILGLAIIMLACSCGGKKTPLYNVKTQLGTVKAVSYFEKRYSVGDSVFVRQIVDTIGNNWEIIPGLFYHEGVKTHRYIISNADNQPADTLYLGIEYRKGVIE